MCHIKSTSYSVRMESKGLEYPKILEPEQKWNRNGIRTGIIKTLVPSKISMVFFTGTVTQNHRSNYHVSVLPGRRLPLRELPLPRDAGLQAWREDPALAEAAQRGPVKTLLDNKNKMITTSQN